MKHFYLLVMVLIASIMQSQNFSLNWEKTNGGSDYDGGMYIMEVTSNDLVAIGTTNSTNGDVQQSYGNYDILVIHMNQSGVYQNSFSYGGSLDDYGVRVLYDNNGLFFVLGYSASSDGVATFSYGDKDFWVICTQTNGSVIWQEKYGGSMIEIMFDALMTPQGDMIMVGGTRSNDHDVSGNHGLLDGWVVSVNKNTGLVNWQLCVGGSQSDNLHGITRLSSGDFIVTGSTSSSNGNLSGNNGGDDVLVAKISANGTLMWAKNFGGSGNEVGYSVTTDSNGNIYIAGQTSSTNFASAQYGAWDAFIMKLDSNGNMQWVKNYGGSLNDNFYSIQFDNGNLYAGGYSESSDVDVSGNYGDKDVWVVKTDLSGTLLQEKNFGGSAYDNAHYLLIDNSGNPILNGATRSNDFDVSNQLGNTDMWTIKLNTTLDVKNNVINWQIYPNPVSDFIHISSMVEFTKLRITDLTGKIIKEVIPGHLTSAYSLNIKDLPSGKYLIHLISKQGNYAKLFIKE